MSKKQHNTEIVWREPETQRRGGNNRSRRLDTIISALKDQPNRWALLTEKRKPVSINPKFRGKEFERAYRTVPTESGNIYRIYVRFVGGKK